MYEYATQCELYSLSQTTTSQSHHFNHTVRQLRSPHLHGVTASLWVKACSLSQLHNHTQTHHARQDSSGRVISPSQRQHTTLTRDKHPCPRRNSNPRSQQASSRRLGSAQVTLQHATFLATPKILLMRHLQLRDTQLFVSAGNSCVWKGTQKRQLHVRLT
jgi:hypothetical protein